MVRMPNRLDAKWLDAALQLLDRQVLDEDGLMVCNVDDLEVTESRDQALAVTGILSGPPALWPRLSGVLGDRLRTAWLRLGVQYAERDVPAYIPLGLVDEIGAAVTLTAGREGLLGRQPPAERGTEHHRLAELLGRKVVTPSGERLGTVLDVRLVPRGGRTSRRLEVSHLVVGRGRPGSLLGYDRRDFNGPWMVHAVVKRLHRHTGTVPMSSVHGVEWGHDDLVVDGPLEPLSGE